MHWHFGMYTLTKILTSGEGGGVQNYLARIIFHDYRVISWASIISLIFWFALVDELFVREYRVNFTRVVLYIGAICLLFYGLTYLVRNPYLGAFSLFCCIYPYHMDNLP